MEQNDVQKILDLLPTLQSTITTLFQHECIRHSIPETEIQCIVDASDESIVCAKIEPGSTPVIRLSATWVFDAIINGRGNVVTECLKRCAMIAHRKLRWTLGGNKPRYAMEYVERQKAFRLCNPSTFSLPIKHFRTTLTVTMTDPLSGETITRENVRPAELQDVQKEVAHELTAKVYAHEQVATILDILYAQQEAAAEPQIPTSVGITMVSADYIIQSLTYEDMKL